MIFMMALIGAITRLTESGLSITRWDVISGTLPPLSDADWDTAFSRYQQSPQYNAINKGMAQEDFKTIYFWEWFHRLWGRLLGVFYALPLLVFWIGGKIPAPSRAPLLAALALGGFQGFIGWFMVQSGLQEGMVSVSHYRLALHLGLALALYGILYWQWLWLGGVTASNPQTTSFCMRRHAATTLLLLSITIIWGALTAGLDAGKIYNSFPLMDGHFFPPDGLSRTPAHLNFFENPGTVQFAHRWIAILTALLAGTLAFRLHRAGLRRLSLLLGTFLVMQMMLGISTLLSSVNITFAAMHQANGILLFTSVIAANYYTFRKNG
jgi:cytochrome c oxidase assembly protein subunit 15